jgi:hypothetical protein
LAADIASREAASAAARISTEQKEAAEAAENAKAASEAVLKAVEEKIIAANEAQRNSAAAVQALGEKIVLAESSLKAADVVERAAIEKKIQEVTDKVIQVQRAAAEAKARLEAATITEEIAKTSASLLVKQAELQKIEAETVRVEFVEKSSQATKAAAAASIAVKAAAAATAAAAKVPSRAVIQTKPNQSTNRNSANATVTGLKPGQKIKVTINVKGR